MEERFSNKELMKQKYGETEKSSKNVKSTNRANNKSGGKYITKIVDGVKYMILNNSIK
jgi:hypothetical protein